MMRQALTEARPERRHEGMSPAIGGTILRMSYYGGL